MLKTYTYPRYRSAPPPELGQAAPRRVPLVVVGAGPVGLAAAIDAAQHGLPVILLDDDETVSVGSRGLCYAKRTLEVLDRLGVGAAVIDKGVTWNVGRTFHQDTEVFHFNLLPEPDHHRPGMVNLQQYWLEQFLVERAQQLPNLDLRWRNKVVSVQHAADGRGALVDVEVSRGDADAGGGRDDVGGQPGRYQLQVDWLVVADGARSPIRRQLGLDIDGRVFQDRFLIADVVLQGELFPAERTERWFWFDPPFHPGQSVLLHREADNVWRIDFQLGWDADPDAEKQPERVIPRIRAMLDAQGYGHIGFELEWVSVYTFQCRRMKRLRDRRVFFIGDAAHQVSPFGARGANSGIQDADNLIWKLAQVMAGQAAQTHQAQQAQQADEALLDSYSEERCAAADDNILNSTRATDFITPKSRASRTLRNAVLTLAREHAFARALVNSGRLSVPSLYLQSSLNTPDDEAAQSPAGAAFQGWMKPGAPMDDAPVQALTLARPLAGSDAAAGDWLLGHVGRRFALMVYVTLGEAVAQLPRLQALAGATAACGPAAAGQALDVFVILPQQGAGGGVGDGAGCAAADAAASIHTLARAGISVLHDLKGLLARRYDLSAGDGYLLRPDQHVAARWRVLDPARVLAAWRRALGWR